MRWRGLALISLGANVLLAALWLFGPRHDSGTTSPAEPSSAQGQSKTNLVIRRQFFAWKEIESADYPTYIANLRDIGCPEQTVRDIIIADVNALYARRRATDPDLVLPEQQWWRSEPDTNVLQTAVIKLRALEDERRGLLTRLLGSNWESGDLQSLPRPSRRAIALNGPILGTLPSETKQAIQEINLRSQQRLQEYLERVRSEGKNPEPLDLARLRQQTRNELTKVLTPAQLEEFLLRYSQGANSLRTDLAQLRYFNATPDEFRAIFRASDPIDQRIELLDPADPRTAQERKSLQQQRDNALRVALGPARYEDYRNLHDPLYRDAVATAQQNGTPEAATTLYGINLAAAAQHQDILANTNLTLEQRNIELKRLELEQLQANTLAMGQELPPEPPVPTQSPRTPRRTYVIQPGDSLAVLSIIYGVPVTDIQAANPNLNLRKLKPGDTIVVPRNPLLAPGP
jgi:LysM repeat protein